MVDTAKSPLKPYKGFQEPLNKDEPIGVGCTGAQMPQKPQKNHHQLNQDPASQIPSQRVPRASVCAVALVAVSTVMDFANVKLRKVTAPKETSAPVPLLCADSADYARLMQETYLEEYLEVLGPVTFATETLPCPPALCAALVAAFEAGGVPRPADEALLRDTAAAIDAVRTAQGWPLLFLRLSSRSPKDAALSQPAFPALLHKHYNTYRAHTEPLNARLLALYAASTEALGVSTGTEALALLMRSARIQDDLRNAPAPLSLCVRRFAAFLPELEVRAFVWHGALTALTQYNALVCSAALLQHRERVAAAVADLFATALRDCIKISNYAVDVIVIGADPARPFDDLRGAARFARGARAVQLTPRRSVGGGNQPVGRVYGLRHV